MTQLRSVSYHALDTSALHNARFIGVLRPGVYKGFRLRPNGAEANKLDITSGSDTSSVLVTSEGIRIEETANLIGVIAIANADPNLDRYDLIVAEYQFTTDNEESASYRVIRGSYASSVDDEPTFPPTSSVFQVPIAYVRVRAQSRVGRSRANIEITDIHHIGRSIDVEAPSGISSLKPVIESSDLRRVYVHAGIVPTFDGTGIISFVGGYSEPVDPDDLSDGESKFYLFGVDDDKNVVLIGSSETVAGLPAFSRDIFPVCYVLGTKLPASGAITFSGLVDIRFPFARQLSPVIEEEVYKATLADSIFRHVRVDPFRNLDRIDLLSLSDSDVTVELDRGETSLNFSGSPSAEVSIATTNMIDATSIGSVRHFMMLVDTDIVGLTMQFSTTSSRSGFVVARFSSGRIVRIPAGGGGSLFIKFIIPAAEVAAGKKIFSYGCFMRLIDEAANVATIADVGLDSLRNSVPNLIANGNFKIWSRDDINGDPVDPDTLNEIAYAVSEDLPFAADGWQFTNFSFPALTGSVARRGLSRDVIETEEENVRDTCLYWEGSAGSSGALGVNTLEYRVPIPPDSEGQRLTFALNFRASQSSVVRVAIAFYELTEQKVLRLQDTPVEVGAFSTSGELLVVSDRAINNRTAAIGFLIYLSQTTGESWAALWGARAALGVFRILPYTEEVLSADILRKYYERGRVYASGNMIEGQTIGTSVQFGSKKHSVLGNVTAQVISQSDSNRSLNVGASNYDTSLDGVVVTATVQSSGLVRIDEDFEVFVTYGNVEE